jgi:hypothetical protein
LHIPLRGSLAPLTITDRTPASPLLTGLVSYWKLDEASGTRSDSHGTNHLTDNNTVTQGVGIIGSAGSFASASLEYLSRVDGADMRPPNYSFQIWYLTSTVNRFGLTKLSGTSGYDMGLTGGGFLFTRIGTGAAAITLTENPTVNTADGNWHHCVVTYDGTTCRLYRNAVLRQSSVRAYSGAAAPFYIGVRDTLVDYWNGRLDEVGLWSRQLQLSEVQQLYNSGAGLAYPFS